MILLGYNKIVKNKILVHLTLLNIEIDIEIWSFSYALVVLRGDTALDLSILVARRGSVRKKKLKRKLFDFKQKKETGKKVIKASQLAIRNFNDITGKNMNTPCVFYFYTVFLKSQSISSTYLQKRNKATFLHSSLK